jgi:sorbitol/mannitol transport system substrate-binding protein
MTKTLRALMGATALITLGVAMAETTMTIATVNNGDMIRMQKLTGRLHQGIPTSSWSG